MGGWVVGGREGARTKGKMMKSATKQLRMNWGLKEKTLKGRIYTSGCPQAK